MKNKTHFNKLVNQQLAKMFTQHDIEYCEVCPILFQMGLLKKPCLGSTTNAHRHKRNWYLGQEYKLSEYNQVVKACMNAHTLIEKSRNITEEVFIKLRGKE